MTRGQIYFADLAQGIGHEQGGIRPVVIIQNDTGNRYSPTTIVAPLTSKQKSALPTHVVVSIKGMKKKSMVLTEQIRTIDKSRIIGSKIGDIPMEAVDSAIRISLGIK